MNRRRSVLGVSILGVCFLALGVLRFLFGSGVIR